MCLYAGRCGFLGQDCIERVRFFTGAPVGGCRFGVRSASSQAAALGTYLMVELVDVTGVSS